MIMIRLFITSNKVIYIFFPEDIHNINNNNKIIMMMMLALPSSYYYVFYLLLQHLSTQTLICNTTKNYKYNK